MNADFVILFSSFRIGIVFKINVETKLRNQKRNYYLIFRASTLRKIDQKKVLALKVLQAKVEADSEPCQTSMAALLAKGIYGF